MIDWRPGDLVRVLTGPFAGLLGIVEEVHADRALLCVRLSVTGTAYRIDLGFTDVEAYQPDDRARDGARWQRGAPVRVLVGPYQYLTGVVQSAHQQCGRVVVRLSGLRPELVVELEDHELEGA
jgi:transcription antitermination factor NusG